MKANKAAALASVLLSVMIWGDVIITNDREKHVWIHPDPSQTDPIDSNGFVLSS